jgi:hypothetical protein
LKKIKDKDKLGDCIAVERNEREGGNVRTGSGSSPRSEAQREFLEAGGPKLDAQNLACSESRPEKLVNIREKKIPMSLTRQAWSFTLAFTTGNSLC